MGGVGVLVWGGLITIIITTCTEQLCYWNSSSKDFTPMKIKDMNIVEHNQEKQNKQRIVNYKEKQSFDPRPESQRIVSEIWKEDFLQNIKCFTFCCYKYLLFATSTSRHPFSTSCIGSKCQSKFNKC